MTSSASTRDRRSGISTATPRRCSRYARSPPILTAEAAGTGSSTSPRRPASRCPNSPSSGRSCSSSTDPSRSPVSVTVRRSTSVRYRLSSPTKHEASLVALPDNTSNSPVANGSSVPACPVRAPVRRRTSATTAKEDGPSGLSIRKIPLGSSARGGTKLAVDELGDLLDRRVAGKPGRLAVTAAVRLARDRGDVELVVRGPEAHPPTRALTPRRLADQRRHLRALDGAQVVDDSLRVRLRRIQVREVALQQVGDHQAPALVDLRPVERACEQLQLRELDRLIDALKDAVHVRAGLHQFGGQAQRLR